MTVNDGIDISLAKDRGLLKRIIQEGVGHELPGAGCDVRVHYTGTLLDGTKFDSSRDRNEPFTFKLGKKSVIKGWDVGVATMKKGEVCVLTCAAEYAYGKNGSPPKIPPNSTLQFEIEMIDWSLDDISPEKNKGILRLVIEEGPNTFDNPADGAIVDVELEGKLHKTDTVIDKRTLTFTLGEGMDQNVCEGIERGLEKFSKGEKSKLIIEPKYGFKSEGNKILGIPPNATLEYTVTLKGFTAAKQVWSMDGPEKLDQGKVYKDRGTDYFKQAKFQMAIKMYKKVEDFLKELVDEKTESEENRAKAKEYLLASYLNLALVYLKLTPAHYLEAKDYATQALGLEPGNVKGLFRRGQALLGLAEAEAATQDFQKVLTAEPDNKAAANQLAACRAAVKQQRSREKQLYANMFDKFAKHDTEVERQRAKEEDVIGESVGEWGAAEGEWTESERLRKPTEFEKENPNILMLDKDGQFQNM